LDGEVVAIQKATEYLIEDFVIDFDIGVFPFFGLLKESTIEEGYIADKLSDYRSQLTYSSDTLAVQATEE